MLMMMHRMLEKALMRAQVNEIDASEFKNTVTCSTEGYSCEASPIAFEFDDT
jgi:hypothetical protein